MRKNASKKAPKRSELVAAINLLYDFMQGLEDTELVIGNGMLRILPGSDEFDLDNAQDAVSGITALKTLDALRNPSIDWDKRPDDYAVVA